MRIRTNIFIWLFFATVLPLTALTLAATYYNEYNYQRQVAGELNSNLYNLGVTIDRQLRNMRNLALGISRSAPVQAYLPVLQGIREGNLPAGAERKWRRVNRYFSGFQTILSGVFTLRVLDAHGNTVAMVNQNRQVDAIFDSVNNIHYAEQEIEGNDLAQTLSQLPRNEVSTLYLPQNHFYPGSTYPYLLQDAVIPLYMGDTFVGALTLTMAGGEIDRILNHSTRLYGGDLMVIELNVDAPRRNGMVLYNQQRQLHIAQIRRKLNVLATPYSSQLFDLANDKLDGVVRAGADERVYFSVINPYPNQFVTWVIASRVSDSEVAAPFATIRIGILLFALAALVVSLILTALGSRRIAQPMCELAGQIKAFADGERHLRAEIRQPIDEVGVLASSFNYLANTLHSTEAERDRAHQMVLQSNKLASIGQMAAGIGHEINNPLNNILSYSKLLSRSLQHQAEKLEPDSYRQLLADIHSLREETLRASDIVKGILNFARQVPPLYSRFKLEPWVQATLTLVKQSANSRSIELQLQLDYRGEVDGDRSQLQQALVNLLLNGIQASPDGSMVLLRCWREARQVLIEVCDSGPGIDEETMDNIFDPFFTTKPEGEGSGLGLSISLGIVERHQGRLTIENSPGRGVCARITLPIRNEVRETV